MKIDLSRTRNDFIVKMDLSRTRNDFIVKMDLSRRWNDFVDEQGTTLSINKEQLWR